MRKLRYLHRGRGGGEGGAGQGNRGQIDTRVLTDNLWCGVTLRPSYPPSPSLSKTPPSLSSDPATSHLTRSYARTVPSRLADTSA